MALRELGAVPFNPTCVWNQAYNEHFQPDSYQDALENAHNCYVLVDPFQWVDAAEKISNLQNNGNSVGCYISTGSCEDWRDDYEYIKEFCVDQKWGEWDGEYFVYDIDGIFPYMKARIDKLASWGCDYVEFDNMDWCTDTYYREKYGSKPGQEFPTTAECAEHNKRLCSYTHENNMLCMSKNSGYDYWPGSYAGGDIMDGATFESYKSDFNWWDDSHLQGFLDNNKFVFIVHYNAGSDENSDSCDYILEKYQDRYNSENISFICESEPHEKYLHYEWESPIPVVAPSLLENGGFEGSVISSWKPFLDGYSVSSISKSGSQGIMVTNGAAKQILESYVSAGSTVKISGWSKASGVSPSILGGNYAIYADVKLEDGSYLWGRKATFQGGTHDWEYSEGTFVLDKAMVRMSLYALYRKDDGKVWFDDVNVSVL